MEEPDPEATTTIKRIDPDEEIAKSDRAKDRRNWVIGGLAVLLAIAVSWQLIDARSGEQDVTTQRDQAVAEKVSLADQIQGECQAGRLIGPVCERSTAIAEGAKPTEAAPGPAGRGIISTDIINSRLFVTYSDGAVVDVGGVRGSDGRGIVATEISDGRLVVTYSDGVIRDLGEVTGPAGTNGTDGVNGTNGQDGVGVQNVEIADGELIMTYTNGTKVNLGKVVGDAGPQGNQGPPGRDGLICPEGQTSEAYTFADGRQGSRCVGPPAASSDQEGGG